MSGNFSVTCKQFYNILHTYNIYIILYTRALIMCKYGNFRRNCLLQKNYGIVSAKTPVRYWSISSSLSPIEVFAKVNLAQLPFRVYSGKGPPEPPMRLSLHPDRREKAIFTGIFRFFGTTSLSKALNIWSASRVQGDANYIVKTFVNSTNHLYVHRDEVE